MSDLAALDDVRKLLDEIERDACRTEAHAAALAEAVGRLRRDAVVLPEALEARIGRQASVAAAWSLGDDDDDAPFDNMPV